MGASMGDSGMDMMANIPEDEKTINYDIQELSENWFEKEQERENDPDHHEEGEGQNEGKENKEKDSPFIDYENVCKDEPLLAVPQCKPTDDPLYHYPTTDGSCNNRVDPRRGKAKFPLKRILPAAYAADGSSPRLSSTDSPLPYPRSISTNLQGNMARLSNLTHMFTQWGQFITHDMVHTPEMMKPNGGGIKDCECGSEDPACLEILLPYNDIQSRVEGKSCMHIVRSAPVPDANCNFNVRNQMNRISSYIDATTVYGNDEQITNMVRDLRALSPDGDNLGMLMFDSSTGEDLLPNQDQDSDKKTNKAFSCPHAQNIQKKPCMLGGDVRVSENVGLASMHLLFMREHNRIAQLMKALNPQWTGDKIFHETRMIIIAMHQQINYREYLPHLLGPKVMKRYGLELTRKGYYFGYDATADATISNEFTTAALRFGHSMITDTLSRVSSGTTGQEKVPLRMKETLFHPFHLYEKGMANEILRGLVEDPSLAADTTFGQDMHNFLFAKHGSGMFGKDLFAINIARGRDHGLRPYNDYRTYCGLRKAMNFEDLKQEMTLDQINKLKAVYQDVNDIDLYVGGLSETPQDGAAVGPTFACIMAEQFSDLRKGDRYWHENGACETVFTPAQLDAIKRGATLSRLICNCAYGTRSINRDAFSKSSPKVNCAEIEDLDLSPWKEPFVHAAKFGKNVDLPDTGEYTAWFPTTSSGRLDLKSISEERPDETCRNALGTEHRSINGAWQVRFLCPAGSLHATDVPRMPSSGVKKSRWTVWFDRNRTSQRNNFDDTEHLKVLQQERPESICRNPIAIQAKTLDDSMFARETGDVFEVLSAKKGLVCRGKHQTSKQCFDYKVRYLCPEDELQDDVEIANGFMQSIDTPESDEDSNRRTSDGHVLKKGLARWSEWKSFSNSIYYNGDIENIELITEAYPLSGFCNTPLSIQARTVDTHLLPSQTGDVIRLLNYKKGLHCYNSDQGARNRYCSNYEIRVLCRVAEPVISSNSIYGRSAGPYWTSSTSSVLRDLMSNPDSRYAARVQAQNLCDKHGMCCT